MTVYVDSIKTYSREAIKGQARRWGTEWCHMFSDNEDKAELHEVAKRIGHKRSWFDSSSTTHHFHHYDLTPPRRELAVKNGAVEIDLRGFIRDHITFKRLDKNDKQNN